MRSGPWVQSFLFGAHCCLYRTAPCKNAHKFDFFFFFFLGGESPCTVRVKLVANKKRNWGLFESPRALSLKIDLQYFCLLLLTTPSPKILESVPYFFPLSPIDCKRLQSASIPSPLPAQNAFRYKTITLTQTTLTINVH